MFQCVRAIVFSCPLLPPRPWAFYAGFNSLFSNVLDLPIYPVLFGQYVSQMFPHLENYWVTILKFVALAMVIWFNIKGAGGGAVCVCAYVCVCESAWVCVCVRVCQCHPALAVLCLLFSLPPVCLPIPVCPKGVRV